MRYELRSTVRQNIKKHAADADTPDCKNKFIMSASKISLYPNTFILNITDCTENDDCTKLTNVCHKYGNCTYNNGSYTCQCAAGYVGDGRTNCSGMRDPILEDVYKSGLLYGWACFQDMAHRADWLLRGPEKSTLPSWVLAIRSFPDWLVLEGTFLSWFKWK